MVEMTANSCFSLAWFDLLVERVKLSRNIPIESCSLLAVAEDVSFELFVLDAAGVVGIDYLEEGVDEFALN